MLKKRIATSLVLVVIALTTIYVDCGKYPGYQINYKYWFKANVAISPYQLNYHAGDTIWLSVNLPNKLLYDTISAKTIRFDSADFNSMATVQLLYNNPFITDGPFVTYVFPDNVVGATSNYSGYTTANVSFGCAPSSDYKVKLGMVLLQKGAFNISFACGSITQCFTNNAVNAQMVFYFDVPDTHLSFYQQLSLDSVGMMQNSDVVYSLQNKKSVAINVE